MPTTPNNFDLRDNHTRGTAIDFLKAKTQCNSMSSSAFSSYNLSFIGASLRPELVRIVAECYLETGDWSLVKEQILSSNALQCRSASSAVRLERELRQRLTTLTHDQLTLLAQATAEDRAAIAWLAACKHVPFVFEFASEALRDKLAAHDFVLRPSDYEGYVEYKSVSHPGVRLKVAGKKKKRGVPFWPGTMGF